MNLYVTKISFKIQLLKFKRKIEKIKFNILQIVPNGKNF